MKKSLLTYLKSLNTIWNNYLRENYKSFLFSLLYLMFVLICLTNFLQFIEGRNGFAFNDPILALFKPIDLTWFTFLVIYGALLIAIISFSDKPQVLNLALLT